MENFEVEAYIEAGKISAEVREYAKKFIKKDMPLLEVAEKIEKKIKDLGGEPAFPVNLSIGEVAAHYTPGKEDKTKVQGLLTVDFGVSVDGFIADTAFSLDFDGKYGEMIKLNEIALDEALAKIKPGSRVGEIGTNIGQRVNESNKKNGTKFSIIKNLTGHSLDENMIHAGLTIQNSENDSKIELEDVAIAIEPFLTEGVGEIYEGKPSEIFMLQSDGQARDKDAREILKFIKENYLTRPFCKRWLEDAGFKKVNFSLSILEKAGVLHNFPVLIEKSKMPVSQAEHTVLILKDKVIVTTK